MSINSDGKHQVGRPFILTRVTSRVLCEKAFTLIELLIVITTIGLMIGAATIVWDATARNMDVQTAAEMFKEDIRNVYSRATAGAPREENGERHRDQYRLEISTSGAVSPTPPNCYRIGTRQWGSAGWGGWDWSKVIPQNAEANKILTDGWIKPSSMSNMQISVVGSTSDIYELIFEAKGSIVQVMAPPDGMGPVSGETVIRLSSSSKTIDVTVSVYGDVS